VSGIETRACGCEASTNDGFLYKTCDLHRDQDPCFKYWPPEVQDMARSRVKAAQAKLSAQPPTDREQLLTDALDFIADNEWGATGSLSAECLDCGADRGSRHSENCRWLALMRKAGRRL